jgi:hypothetical protein
MRVNPNALPAATIRSGWAVGWKVWIIIAADQSH